MKSKLNLLGMGVLSLLTLLMISCNSGAKSGEKEAAKSDEAVAEKKEADFKISLAQWSLHKSYFGGEIKDWEEFGRLLEEDPDALLKGDIDPIDFPKKAAEFGIESIELVNTLYFSKYDDMEYWAKFKKNCEDAGVSVGLIMCDRLGHLGDSDEKKRAEAIEKHHKWIDIASFLGAQSIRVNAAGEGTAEEVSANAVAGLSKLAEYAATKNVNVVVENHGGYSSNGAWLADVMKKVGKENVGTLPDFGNFCIERGDDGCKNEYDRYKGMAELMPYAKGVSAKSHEFDANGNEVNSDFARIMKIVKDSGFKGYVGIEYEGKELSEEDGIKATKALLEKVFAEL